jgi:hypothetical protein
VILQREYIVIETMPVTTRKDSNEVYADFFRRLKLTGDSTRLEFCRKWKEETDKTWKASHDTTYKLILSNKSFSSTGEFYFLVLVFI